MSSMDAPSSKPKVEGIPPLPMIMNWSKVDKPAAGRAIYGLSLSLASVTILCAILCFAHIHDYNQADGLRNLIHSKSGSVLILLLAIAAVIGESVHLNYERNIGYTILPNDNGENTLPLTMACVLLLFYLFRCISNFCIKGSRFCDMSCSVSNNEFILLLAVVAAGTLIYFVADRMKVEEMFEYKNLEEPVVEQRF